MVWNRFIKCVMACAMSLALIPQAEQGTASEQLRTLQPARPREEHGKHTHNDIAGEAENMPPIEAAQAPLAALEEDGYSALEITQRASRANEGRYRMLPHFDAEEFVPHPEESNNLGL
jgi:hypothetical protein